MRFAGFSLKQWVVLLVGGGGLIGLVSVLNVPTKPAITLCAFVIGVPAAIAYVSEGGGVSPARLLRDLWHWRTRPSRLHGGASGDVTAVLVAAERDDATAAPSKPPRGALGRGPGR
jgi:hypothetical protein